MTFPRIAALALSLSLLTGTATLAHEAAKGPNGGVLADAGVYHVELVVDGSTAVAIYLSDADDKPVAAKDFKANAILVIDGKSQRFALAPDQGSKLLGTAPSPVKPGVKGAVQVTAPNGATAQAKY